MNIEWTVTNYTALQRFEVRIGDQIAVLNYRIDSSRVTFFSCGRPAKLGGEWHRQRHGVYSLERRDLK